MHIQEVVSLTLTLSAGFFRMTVARFTMAVTPVPPARSPAARMHTTLAPCQCAALKMCSMKQDTMLGLALWYFRP